MLAFQTYSQMIPVFRTNFDFWRPVTYYNRTCSFKSHIISRKLCTYFKVIELIIKTYFNQPQNIKPNVWNNLFSKRIFFFWDCNFSLTQITFQMTEMIFLPTNFTFFLLKSNLSQSFEERLNDFRYWYYMFWSHIDVYNLLFSDQI